MMWNIGIEFLKVSKLFEFFHRNIQLQLNDPNGRNLKNVQSFIENKKVLITLSSVIHACALVLLLIAALAKIEFFAPGIRIGALVLCIFHIGEHRAVGGNRHGRVMIAAALGFLVFIMPPFQGLSGVAWIHQVAFGLLALFSLFKILKYMKLRKSIEIFLSPCDTFLTHYIHQDLLNIEQTMNVYNQRVSTDPKLNDAASLFYQCRIYQMLDNVENWTESMKIKYKNMTNETDEILKKINELRKLETMPEERLECLRELVADLKLGQLEFITSPYIQSIQPIKEKERTLDTLIEKEIQTKTLNISDDDKKRFTKFIKAFDFLIQGMKQLIIEYRQSNQNKSKQIEASKTILLYFEEHKEGQASLSDFIYFEESRAIIGDKIKEFQQAYRKFELVEMEHINIIFMEKEKNIHSEKPEKQWFANIKSSLLDSQIKEFKDFKKKIKKINNYCNKTMKEMKDLGYDNTKPRPSLF